MQRRELLRRSAALGLAAALPAALPFAAVSKLAAGSASTSAAAQNPLKPPAKGTIPVAFLISDDAVIIDFCGPWEVFENVGVHGRMESAFRLYTVAEMARPIRAGGGMKIIPDYTLATAPAPAVIVIPAQIEPSEAVLEWVRNSTQTTDVTMSVCTGAFLLAKTGLLSGRSATTHHSAYMQFAMDFPDILLKRGARFVEDGNLASAGGLTSGIDLALRVVERYFGRQVAKQTADQLEYQGQGWLNPESNQMYAKRRISTEQHPLCPVCEMDVDPGTAPKSTYRGKTYYFCTQSHKTLFEAAPDRILEAMKTS